MDSLTRAFAVVATVSNYSNEDAYSNVVYASTDHELVVRRFKEVVSNYIEESNPSAVVKFLGKDELFAEASYDDWDVFATFEIHSFALDG